MTKVKIRDLVFGYDEQNLIVDGLLLFYETPDVLCVLGVNGAGKSTLLQCLTGGLKPASGSISINGAALGSYSTRTLARLIVYIPQTHVLSFGFSVLDVVTMGRTSRMDYIATPGPTDVHVAQEQLAYLGISHLCDKPYTEVSGGERQLVMIAAALAQEPELLVLDEPTAHLDFGNQYRFLRLVQRLRERGVGVLMTTHVPDHALLLGCTTAVMRDGRIEAMGPACDVVTAERMAELYGIDVCLGQVGDRRLCIPGAIGDSDGYDDSSNK